jgi:type VI secretion system secreted protein Hcp
MAMASQNLGFLKLKMKNAGAQKGAGKILKIGSLDVKEMIEFHQLDHQIDVPFDEQHGGAKGRRRHRPIRFRIDLDAGPCVAQLANCACKNDTIEEAKFHLHRTNEKGESEIFYTITLKNGVITEYNTHLPNVHDKNVQGSMGAFVEIGVSYEEITWECPVWKTTGNDSWKNQ